MYDLIPLDDPEEGRLLFSGPVEECIRYACDKGRVVTRDAISIVEDRAGNYVGAIWHDGLSGGYGDEYRMAIDEGKEVI